MSQMNQSPAQTPAGTRDYVRDLERDSLAFVESIDRDPFLGRVIRGDVSRELYVRFLRSTYHYVRWSGPLLAETAHGLRRRRAAHWLVDLLDAKTREESPHDRWALADLEACGDNVELTKAAAPAIAIAAYVDWSRSLAQEGSLGYLGAAYTLEFISAHRASVAADALLKRSAIPRIESALVFLTGHGHADDMHLASLGKVLSQIADPTDRAAIALSAAVMRTLYPLFFSAAAPAL